MTKPGIKSHVMFGLAKTNITSDQEMNIMAIADYLKKYPEAKASVMGYADKGTGNATINKGLSEKRAQIVVDTLVKDFGISASRIKSDSKGDTVQPFEEEVLNRVSICLAK